MFKQFISSVGGAVILLASSQANAIQFTLGNDGVNSTVSSIVGNETATEYYDYRDFIGHPDFGRMGDSGYFWLYEDSRSGDVSLGMLLDTPDTSGNGGTALVTFNNLPSSFRVDVKEETRNGTDELRAIDSNTAYGDWFWQAGKRDGGVIGGLDGGLGDISVVIHEYTGINDWFFVNGPSTDSADLILLNSEGFSLAAGATTVPEPSALFLIAAGLMGWTLMRRKHMVTTKLH